METAQFINAGLRVIAAILALRIVLWTWSGFKQWFRNEGVPLSTYRAGLFVLIFSILSFNISRFAGVVEISTSPWAVFNILGIIAGLLIVQQGRAIALDKGFDRLWAIYPHIEDAEKLARLKTLLPEEVDMIMEVIERRIAAAENIAKDGGEDGIA